MAATRVSCSTACVSSKVPHLVLSQQLCLHVKSTAVGTESMRFTDTDVQLCCVSAVSCLVVLAAR